MPQGLTYRDALKILGDDQSRMVKMLDAAATAGLTAWTATAWTSGADPGTALSLFDMKSDVIRYAGSVLRRMSEWRSGISRFDRTQRLVAAHAVIVVSSFFECLDEVLEQAVPGFETASLGITRDEQAAHVLNHGKRTGGYAGLMEFLGSCRLPTVEPSRSRAEIREETRKLYVKAGHSVQTFIEGLAVHDDLNWTQRGRLRSALLDVPSLALRHYDENYRQLVADSREFEVWAGLAEDRAIGSALSRLGELLVDLRTQQPVERTRAHLELSYQAAMRNPIVATRQAPEGVVLPSLKDAYINPRCRVAAVGEGDSPASREWWRGQTEVADVNAFLVAHLTSSRATEVPLVVLGDPGSGKSKLTEVLAARLLEGDFLPIRVELRDVAAESLVREQIEQAIYQRPGERVAWHDLLQSAGGLLPVVLLDGFDEMLQATDVNRYDYFEQVCDLQREQLALQRPIAVIITSRTVVADRARFPMGSLALQLQPFDTRQIERWVGVWNRHNSTSLAERGLSPLAVGDVIAQKELSEQPLLLLLLAIFDSTDNALRSHSVIGRAELYRSLFMDFALREVRKDEKNRRLSQPQQDAKAERELMRLAIVALSMFNRGRQLAREDELNHDLPILFPERDLSEEDSRLTPAQRATGRFFFIHKSEARQHADRARSYEFLHATFGEFFVAWLAVRAMRELAQTRETLASRLVAPAEPPDDRFLYSVLSFAYLAARAPIIDFVAEMLKGMEDRERVQCQELLRTLLSGALYLSPSTSYGNYEPLRHPTPRRMATYSANLVTLYVLTSDGDVAVDELLGDDIGYGWSELAHLWKAFLAAGEWLAVQDTLRIDENPQGVRLKREDNSSISLVRSIGLEAARDYCVDVDRLNAEVAPDTTFGGLLRRQGFVGDGSLEKLLVLAAIYVDALGDSALDYHFVSDSAFVPAHVIAQLDLAGNISPEKRFEYYMQVSNLGVRPIQEEVLLRLRQDVETLSVGQSVRILRAVYDPMVSDEICMGVVNAISRHAQGAADRGLVSELIDHLRDLSPDLPLGEIGRA